MLFFPSIAAWVAKSALMSSPVGAFLKRIPRQVWIALAIAAALVAAFLWHQHAMHKALKQAHDSGYAQARSEDQAAIDKARAAARDWKLKADQANETIHKKEQALHDQTVANNHALADALRMRVHANAAAQSVGGSRTTMSGAASAADRQGRPDARTDARVVAQADPLVCVPAGRLIDYAEQADNDHDALIRTEDAWKQYEANQPKVKPR
jgi:hypothetical protein